MAGRYRQLIWGWLRLARSRQTSDLLAKREWFVSFLTTEKRRTSCW